MAADVAAHLRDVAVADRWAVELEGDGRGHGGASDGILTRSQAVVLRPAGG